MQQSWVVFERWLRFPTPFNPGGRDANCVVSVNTYFSANALSRSFLVLLVPLLQLGKEGEDVCTLIFCLFMQHLLVRITEPLANSLSHRSGIAVFLSDPDKAADGETARLRSMKKTWGLLLYFYTFFVLNWPKIARSIFKDLWQRRIFQSNLK